MSRIGQYSQSTSRGRHRRRSSPGRVTVHGPARRAAQDVPLRMAIEQEEGTIVVTRPTERGQDRALHGLTRTLVANMVEGVTKGFEKRLEIQGVGYRAALHGTDLELHVGYSHSGERSCRAQGIKFEVPAPTAGRRQGHRQAAGRPDRRGDPQGAPARAVQGQGHPLRGRVRPQEGREARMSKLDDARGAPAPPSPRARQGLRHRRAAAPGRVPLEPRHLRAARRRRERQDARGRRAGCTSSASRAQDRAGRARSASCSRRPRRRPASRPSSSTAAATCTTAASKRSPTARAKED